MIEMAIAIPVLLLLTLGFVDFGYAFYQWNAGNKAVQFGARLAKISSPIPVGLAQAVATVPPGAAPGDSVIAQAYDYTCSTNSAGAVACTCTGEYCVTTTDYQCTFDVIFYGDDYDDAVNGCPKNLALSGSGRSGMRDLLPTLNPSEVTVEYVATGLDFWTRPGGPIPTIKVSISHRYEFFFLGGLLGFASPTMNIVSTVTGEDLNSAAP